MLAFCPLFSEVAAEVGSLIGNSAYIANFAMSRGPKESPTRTLTLHRDIQVRQSEESFAD
jgi:hypothetical protein